MTSSSIRQGLPGSSLSVCRNHSSVNLLHRCKIIIQGKDLMIAVRTYMYSYWEVGHCRVPIFSIRHVLINKKPGDFPTVGILRLNNSYNFCISPASLKWVWNLESSGEGHLPNGMNVEPGNPKFSVRSTLSSITHLLSFLSFSFLVSFLSFHIY